MLKPRNQILPFSVLRKFIKHFSAIAKNQCEESTKRVSLKQQYYEKRKQKLLSSSLDIIQYLTDIGSESLIKELHLKHVRFVKDPQSLNLFDAKVADEFVNMIKGDFTKESSSFVIEINPGPAVLTNSLLQTTIPKIHLYEASSWFTKPNCRLQLLVNKNPDRLEIRKCNILKMWEAAYLDFKDSGKRLHEMLEGIEKRKWNEEPYMTLIGAVANSNFLKHITMSVIFQNTFMENGRILLYLGVPPSTWEKLIALNNSHYYTNRTILFQLLFNYTKIGELPRKAFLPWLGPNSKIINHKCYYMELDRELIYLVKIEPKADLFDHFKNKDDLLRFYYFIKHHMLIKHKRIIPELEHWIPHCGPRLIAQNFNIYSEFDELNPSELLELYKSFSSWPEFETSSFLMGMTSYINNLQDEIYK